MTGPRERILSSIRESLKDLPPQAVDRPGAPEIWPADPSPPEVLFSRFERELAAVHGEAIRVGSAEQAGHRVRSLAEQFRWHRIGIREHELTRAIAGNLPAAQVAKVDQSWSPQKIAELDAGIVIAELFLADTGSSLILCQEKWERLLCYLPPACVIVGYLDRLYAHMAAAWSVIAAWSQDRATRGEFVIVTGPSRTSDIEKVLTLGVHGPKQLWAILVE